MTADADPGPRATKADERRRLLMATARRLFIAQGFHQTGIAQIAEESGVRVGQIYRDFSSKGDLIVAITLADLESWLDQDLIEAAIQSGDRQAAKAWLEAFAGRQTSHDEGRLLLEVFAESGRNPRVTEAVQQSEAQLRSLIEGALATMTGQNRPTPSRTKAVEILLALSLGYMVRRVLTPDGSWREISRHALDLVEQEEARALNLDARSKVCPSET